MAGLLSRLFGDGPHDWYVPPPMAYPHTSDSIALPQSLFVPPPEVPQGSLYSPSRNTWLTPDGKMISAGEYRPLPPDQNTYDSHQLMPLLDFIRNGGGQEGA